jgi:hypothetical protein
MSAPFRRLDTKARRMLVAGNLSLALAVMLCNFKPQLSAGHDWYDGVYGFFFGVSIGLNLLGIAWEKRCRRIQA